MIDDILFQMVEGVDRHFNDPLNDATYQGALRERIIRLRDDAEYIVFVIDTPYPEWRLPEGFVRERIVKERLEAREQAEKETATSLKHRESWLQTPNKEHEDYNEAVVTLALQLSE